MINHLDIEIIWIYAIDRNIVMQNRVLMIFLLSKSFKSSILFWSIVVALFTAVKAIPKENLMLKIFILIAYVQFIRTNKMGKPI